MAENTIHIVRDWVSDDYQDLSAVEIDSFVSTTSNNNDLIKAIFIVLEEKKYHEEFLAPVCHQLFSFYRSRNETLQNFTRQYIPPLVGLYLSNVVKENIRLVRCVEVLLLGIYNLEVTDPSGKPISHSFRIPSLSKPSIFHEPMSLSHSMLTEHALSKLEYADSHRSITGPYKEVEKINASNRLQVMTVLMWVYNQHIGQLSTFSHMSVCKMSSRMVKQGYNRTSRSNYGNDCSSSYGNPHPRPVARIPLSSAFMLEIIHSVYFAMFNGLENPGLQSLEELHNRAMHELLSDVLLVTTAIRNSLKTNPSGQPTDGPMGISVALSPTTTVSNVSRAVLTNASFRTKKLPDDIPIQTDGDTSENHHLSSINEEGEEADVTSKAGSSVSRARDKKPSSHNNAINSSASKTSVLQLRKDKTKDKRKESSSSENSLNGKSVSVNAVGNGISDTAISNSNSDEGDTIKFNNNEQMYNPLMFRIETQTKSPVRKKSSPDIDSCSCDGFTPDTVCVNNHIGQAIESNVIREDTYILQPKIPRSESENSQQNVTLQTVV